MNPTFNMRKRLPNIPKPPPVLRDFLRFLPNLPIEFWLCHECLFDGPGHKNHPLSPLPLSLTKGPLPSDCRLASWLPPPGATPCVVVVTTLPMLVLRLLLYMARLPPSLELIVGRIDEGSQRTPFFSSQGQFVGVFSDNRLWIRIAAPRFLSPRSTWYLDAWPPTSTALWLSTSMKFLSPLHDAFTTFLPQSCDNTFKRADTIFLLVRQKLQRVDQVITQPLRCCMRFEGLRFMCIGTDLYHQ